LIFIIVETQLLVILSELKMDAFLKSGKLGQAKQASEKPASQPEKVNILNQLITRIVASCFSFIGDSSVILRLNTLLSCKT
jgi:hypothetical protein